ncbi:DUF6504 family protein [Chloroflexota bacterium]
MPAGPRRRRYPQLTGSFRSSVATRCPSATDSQFDAWISMAAHGGKIMAWKYFDERVTMAERRFQYFPDTFLWRGHPFRVEEVDRCWTRSRRGWKGPGRHYFQVRCAEGTFELYQETRAATWHLRRAKLARRQRRGPKAWSRARRSALAWG